MGEAFFMIVLLAIARNNVPNAKDRILQLTIDKRWKATLNGHSETRNNIPPFHVYVEYNGFPAGIIGAHSGCIAAGEAANERTLIRALRKIMPKDKLAELDAQNPRRGKREVSRQVALFPETKMGET